MFHDWGPLANAALASAIEPNAPSATAAHNAAPTAASSPCGPTCSGIANSASSAARSTGFSLMPLPAPTSLERAPPPSRMASRYESANSTAMPSNSARVRCPAVSVAAVSSRKEALARGLLRDPENSGSARTPSAPAVHRLLMLRAARRGPRCRVGHRRGHGWRRRRSRADS